MTNFYIIGDNASTDIKGGNKAGCITILVGSGVFDRGSKDKQYPATHLVENLEQAVELIFKLEIIN